MDSKYTALQSYFMRTIINLLYGLLLLSSFNSLSAQEYFFDVESINVENGLPNRSVQNITQDLEGYMWFSFVGLIARYDGHSFKKYDAKFLGITESVTTHLAIDKDNYIWYCENKPTYKTITGGVINTQLDTIYRFEDISNGLIQSSDILCINQSRINKTAILIFTKKGNLYRYDGRFHKVGQYDFDISSLITISDYSDGTYWLTIDKTIIKFKNQKIIDKFSLPDAVNRITTVYNESFIKMMYFSPIKLYKLNDKNIPTPVVKNNNEELLDIYEINKDYYCVITAQHIIIKGRNNKEVLKQPSLDNLQTRSSFKDVKLFIDKQDILWFSSENGIIKITLKQNPFSIIDAGNSIRGITKIGDELFVGGYYGNQITNLKTNKKQTFLPIDMTANGYTKDENGYIWIGTSTPNLIKYNPETKTFVKFRDNVNGKGLFLPYFNTLTNHLWVGTSEGLEIFNRTAKTFTNVKLSSDDKNIEVRQFFEKNNDVWIITNKGIFIVNKKTEKVQQHYSTANELVYDNLNYIHQDKDGVFWIGTRGGGLLYWNPTKQICQQITKENGLSNDNIYTVYEDEFNALWLPSDYGLMRLDKTTMESRVYLPSEGIAYEEFNAFANYQDENGRLYFGGLSGVTAFHPKDLSYHSTYMPPLKITQVKILKADEDFFRTIPFDFSKDKKVTLQYSDKIIELHLAFLNFSNSSENKYAYKINGYQNQWVYLDKNVISLVNLPSGKYNLEIKARGEAGNWISKTESILIVIKPPFYLQTNFIAFSVIFIIAIVLGIIWLRINKFKQDKLRLETEVAKRTQTIQQQTKELKALDKTKTRFFSNITHEFRTPLTLIIGPLEQLTKHETPLNQLNTTQKLNGILRNAYRLLELINQLLDLSKLESNKMPLEITHGDIVSYTKDLTDNFRVIAEKKDQVITTGFPPTSWEINFDKDKWNKIIFNLLSNAIKFTPDGGKIELKLNEIQVNSESFIFFQISDNGIGINEKDLKEIFNRFYQVDDASTRLQEGTGIGLSLVKELVKIQQGEIKVTSEIGKGTAFIIKIPIPSKPTVIETTVSQKTKNFIPQLPTEKSVSQPKSVLNSEKLHLLIIEDNDEMRLYFRDCLDESVYEITEARNGEEGIEIATATVPDLIISDVMMPKKDGFEVVQAIRKQVSTSHIPIILLTAKTSLESRLKGIEKGADAYLTKPFSPKELRLRVQKLIEIRQLLQKNYYNFSKNSMVNVYENSTAQNEIEDEFIVMIKSFVFENIESSELNGDIIGAEFNISRMQLHRKIKALTNLTVGEFIRNLRFAKAIEFMKTGQLNISEISYSTGFSSPSQFSKNFKKEFGVSPSEYLKTQNE
jgi:signal transduction histidine kinase/DNA-binding response OmpR family regulator/streptogramin lyase